MTNKDRSEHDEGYILGVNGCLSDITQVRSLAMALVETRREKDAIHKVCEMIRAQIKQRRI